MRLRPAYLPYRAARAYAKHLDTKGSAGGHGGAGVESVSLAGDKWKKMLKI